MNTDLLNFLERNFDLTTKVESDLSEENILDLLDRELRIRLELMIGTNMEYLLQILYRIDVNQKLVDEAFSLGDIKKICESLSSLIIQRQLKKLAYSRSYKGE